MTAYSDDTSPPMLAEDGETILVHLRGRTEDGVFYHGFEEFFPGDPGYDEMLPVARENPYEKPEPERPLDEETLALVFREAGSDRRNPDE
ncbi:hypothetical protein NWFMUON74_17800 [Nocardia wallacei]|uniref:Uncharacterized protein n=2 Tax=Nocardia wallacei TaxID=480035 RepID=A0A7G1KFW8_9NOCA|nr:hypothetical protein [Nocardia wallacei]BCK54008.1 hypothetical protein NWFMUON74_17800 [Nocardia wallacei]